MTTEERLERVEKELARGRWFNRGLLAALGVVLAGIALAWAFAPGTAGAQGANGAAKEIRANAFILDDAEGKLRAILGVGKDGPTLGLFNENGKVSAELSVEKDGPTLSLRDEKGERRAMLTVLKDGPGLVLLDENGKLRAGLAVSKGGPGLALYDKNGKVIWSAP